LPQSRVGAGTTGAAGAASKFSPGASVTSKRCGSATLIVFLH
jgi:hypothetical protein